MHARDVRGLGVKLMICGIGVFAALGVAAPGEAAEPTPVQVFYKFRRDRDPKRRLQALSQLSGERGADVVKALLGALGDEDAKVRKKAGSLLRERRDRPAEIEALAVALAKKRPEPVRLAAVKALTVAGKPALTTLQLALDDRSPAVRVLTIQGLVESGGESQRKVLAEALTDEDALVRAEACHGLGEVLGAGSVGFASAILRGDRSPEPKVAAASALLRHPTPDAVEHLVHAVRDSHWSVRVACSRALAVQVDDASAARTAVEALVVAIPRERRLRVRHEMADALFLLTGIDFGPAPERWVAWWDEAGHAYEPPKRTPRRSKAGNKGVTRGHLLDLPIDSDHVCFVLDNSHSMNDPVRFGVRRTKREALVGAFGACVEGLPEGSWLNVIPFGTEPLPYKPALFKGSSSGRRAAVKYLKKHRPDGRTNLYDSVALALADPQTDTVVIVTDGAPSAGAHRSRRSILDAVRQLNRFRLARIHTVEVGAKNTGTRWRGFMRRLAELTGGYYLER